MPFISGEATITIAYLVDSVNRFFPISRNSGNSTRNIMFFYYSDERDFLAPSASVFRPPLPRIFVPPSAPRFCTPVSSFPVPHSRVCLSSRSRALPAPRFRTPAPCFSLPPSPLPTSYRFFSPHGTPSDGSLRPHHPRSAPAKQSPLYPPLRPALPLSWPPAKRTVQTKQTGDRPFPSRPSPVCFV